MPEISNGWALLGLLAVLTHQMLGRWWDRRQDKLSSRRWRNLLARLDALDANDLEYRLRLERVESALAMLARGVARPPDPDTK
jgi:hypothetical protein